jgi:hypothetical protein
MEIRPPEDVTEPKVGRLWLLFLRGLNLVSFVLVIWSIQRVGLLAAIVALGYPLAAWWLRPSTLHRGLARNLGAAILLWRPSARRAGTLRQPAPQMTVSPRFS